MKNNTVLLICIFVTGCLGESDYYNTDVLPFLESIEESYKPGVYDNVKEPEKFPDIEVDQSTLVGIDMNKDGVRDDVEIFLNRFMKIEYERLIYKNFFRTAKSYFEAKTKQEWRIVQNERWKRLECFSYLRDAYEIQKSKDAESFKAFTVMSNTSNRKNVGQKRSQILAGESISSGISNYKQAFETCPETVKIKFPLIDKK